MQVIKKALCLLLICQTMHSVELGSALKDEIATAPKVRIILGLDATTRHKNVENRILLKQACVL